LKLPVAICGNSFAKHFQEAINKTKIYIIFGEHQSIFKNIFDSYSIINLISNNMKISLFQIDAFANKVFWGNPAAVCPLEKWIDDSLMQAIAAENNLSETAFFVKSNNHYELRWFTPATEVDLCGHATLAAAFVLFNELRISAKEIVFHTKSGPITVGQQGELLEMDFPMKLPIVCDVPDDLIKGLGKKPTVVLSSEDYLAVFDSEKEVRNIKPDFERLKRLALRGVIVTSPGERADFVSRFFAPKLGIDEDPVTGSAHCSLAPYWERRLGKNKLHAMQLSSRGGELYCEVLDERVLISGKAVKFLQSEICI
tara:strand:- start:29752 stop:30687 length:936 start_codon:yes stop_codon:yes gene_type:complete